MRNISIKVTDEFHKLIRLNFVEKDLELKGTIIDLLKAKAKINFEGKKWCEAKHIFENYMHVDKDNVDSVTKECIVDFTNEFNEYSISGKLDDEGNIIIEDNACIYKNVL